MKILTYTSAITLTLAITIAPVSAKDWLTEQEMQDVVQSNFDTSDANVMTLHKHTKAIHALQLASERSAQIDEDIGQDILQHASDLGAIKNDLHKHIASSNAEVDETRSGRRGRQRGAMQRDDANEYELQRLITSNRDNLAKNREYLNRNHVMLSSNLDSIAKNTALSAGNEDRLDEATKYISLNEYRSKENARNAALLESRVSDLTDISSRVQFLETEAISQSDAVNGHLDNINHRVVILEAARAKIAAANDKIKANNDIIAAKNEQVDQKNSAAKIEVAAAAASSRHAKKTKINPVNHNIGAALHSISHDFKNSRGSLGVGVVGGVGGSNSPAVAIGAAYRISGRLTGSLTISNSIQNFDLGNTAASASLSLSF